MAYGVSSAVFCNSPCSGRACAVADSLSCRLQRQRPGVRQILRLMGPAILGAAAVQINVFVNTSFASAIVDPATGAVANGPVSWLNYAFRFMQFPIGVFGVAIATATCRPCRAARPIPIIRNSAKPWRTLWRWYFSCASRRRSVWQCWGDRSSRWSSSMEVHRLRHRPNGQRPGGILRRPGRLRRHQSVVARVLRAQRRAHADAGEPRLHRRKLCHEFAVGRNVRPCRFGVLDFGRRAGKFFFARAVYAPPHRRLAGRKLAVTAVKIALASAALAVVAWVVNELAGDLPLHGLALHFIQVS